MGDEKQFGYLFNNGRIYLSLAAKEGGDLLSIALEDSDARQGVYLDMSRDDAEILTAMLKEWLEIGANNIRAEKA